MWIACFYEGGSKDLMQEIEKGDVMVEVRPKGYIEGSGLDIQRYRKFSRVLFK